MGNVKVVKFCSFSCVGFQSLPGPYKTFLSRVPHSDFLIQVLKKVGCLGSRYVGFGAYIGFVLSTVSLAADV